MKKIALILAVSLLFVAGCSKGKQEVLPTTDPTAVATPKPTPAPTPTPSPTPKPKAVEVWPAEKWNGTEPVFFLIIGSDEGSPRYGRGGAVERGRADSIHVLAVNPKTKSGTIYGIPRDTYVSIPGHGRNKINSAMVFGGPDLMVKTVSQFTGLPINFYALTSFHGLEDLVNAVGGIDVLVPYRMNDKFSGAYFEPGMRHMNGHDALAFSRNRKNTPRGDFSRSENQGVVLLSLFARGKEMSKTPAGFLKALNIARAHVTFNLPWRDVIGLANLARASSPANFKNVVMSGHGGMAGKASVVYADASAYNQFKDMKSDAVLNGQ